MKKNFCIHDKNKYRCIECNPKSFCEHKKIKCICTKCKPEINEKRRMKKQKRPQCEHLKRKDNCKICSGCIHGKLCCIICNPKQYCEHKIKKTQCKKCKGGSICPHNKRKSLCIECDGGSICKHKKRRSRCKECGNSFCEHNKLIYYCKVCKPELYFMHLQRSRLKNILKNLGEKEHTNEYLGCSSSDFFKHILSKMTPCMTYENIHIDHIKPISKFNLENKIELYQCCHWSNLQPLLAKDNLVKGNKWSEKDEINWKENIIKI